MKPIRNFISKADLSSVIFVTHTAAGLTLRTNTGEVEKDWERVSKGWHFHGGSPLHASLLIRTSFIAITSIFRVIATCTNKTNVSDSSTQ